MTRMPARLPGDATRYQPSRCTTSASGGRCATWNSPSLACATGIDGQTILSELGSFTVENGVIVGSPPPR